MTTYDDRASLEIFSAKAPDAAPDDTLTSMWVLDRRFEWQTGNECCSGTAKDTPVKHQSTIL